VKRLNAFRGRGGMHARAVLKTVDEGTGRSACGTDMAGRAMRNRERSIGRFRCSRRDRGTQYVKVLVFSKTAWSWVDEDVGGSGLRFINPPHYQSHVVIESKKERPNTQID
jgi:hypothetical protein